ncbi:protein FAR-RED IMPAIRED RESPONSE 1-like protein [Cinnamomum micranthum f. kanehirae]|uniref:Protein FAR1-RELATED SEQUENCE n=1 Tax=Cinnamomum micranthum f. kanehirae TaxID=337451 RepID=A0A3S3NU03_9MAGN|nr:protein FAR-RED IMPAIRED RESPONSE 1-like protein [Cinnamomum micranthum f. kanehirae]
MPAQRDSLPLFRCPLLRLLSISISPSSFLVVAPSKSPDSQTPFVSTSQRREFPSDRLQFLGFSPSSEEVFALMDDNDPSHDPHLDLQLWLPIHSQSLMPSQLPTPSEALNSSQPITCEVAGSQAGGRDKVGFTETDFRNHIRDKNEETKDNDGDMFYEHFRQWKERDLRNFFAIEKDDEDHIKHVFWADYYFQKSYEEFGDVVSFDTTYNTNRYGLIFGAFTGINHHDQSIIFGCCLISNETFDTFVWVFNKWLKAMPGDPPKSILTDQDPAMTKAIGFVLPTTSHRYCLWHILENLQKNLGGVAIHKDNLIPTIKKIAFNSLTTEEFESGWKKMLIKEDVANNDWLNGMYDIRHMWVPIYMRHLFFGGMSTTGRSESINAFLKQYVTQKNGLCGFMFRFNQGIATQKYRQLKAIHDTSNGRPKLMTDLPMERQMSQIYTKKLFYKFQDQFMYITSGIAEIVNDDMEQRIYNVSSFKDNNEIERVVIFKKDEKYAKCSCQLFEFKGIPCGHIICVLKQEKIYTMPEQYILKRWTRYARVDDDSDRSMCSEFDGSLLARHGDLSYDASNIIDEASLSKEAYHHAKSVLQNLKTRIREINEKTVMAEDDPKRKKKSASPTERYLPPKQAITKGRPKRLKSSKEKARKKDRLCRGCGKRGVAHDRRNCPGLDKSSVENNNQPFIENEALERSSEDEALTQLVGCIDAHVGSSDT